MNIIAVVNYNQWWTDLQQNIIWTIENVFKLITNDNNYNNNLRAPTTRILSHIKKCTTIKILFRYILGSIYNCTDCVLALLVICVEHGEQSVHNTNTNSLYRLCQWLCYGFHKFPTETYIPVNQTVETAFAYHLYNLYKSATPNQSRQSHSMESAHRFQKQVKHTGSWSFVRTVKLSCGGMERTGWWRW